MNKPDYLHFNVNLFGNTPEHAGNFGRAVTTTSNLETVGASGYTPIDRALATGYTLTPEPHWVQPGWWALIKMASVRSVRQEQWFSECVQWGDKALQNAVEIDPKRRGGIPVLKGTRFTVGQTLAELADSTGVPEVANRFDLDQETIRELLYGLALLAERPRT